MSSVGGTGTKGGIRERCLIITSIQRTSRAVGSLRHCGVNTVFTMFQIPAHVFLAHLCQQAWMRISAFTFQTAILCTVGNQIACRSSAKQDRNLLLLFALPRYMRSKQWQVAGHPVDQRGCELAHVLPTVAGCRPSRLLRPR